MEIFDIESGLNAIASAGNTLNVLELTGIRSGLTKLKADQKLEKIYFWGKIFGDDSPYYIAYNLCPTEFEFPPKKFYYAGEKFEFAELPIITEEAAFEIIETCQDRYFTGKPETLLKQPAGEGEAPAEGEAAAEPVKALTELDYLAQVVQEIDFDTAAVPKGAYALNEAHQVVPSIDFKGLGFAEACSLMSYLHFRPPQSVAKLRALARDDVQFYAGFLDTLDEDLPTGCWATRKDPSATLVTLRSLNWPGYVAFHIPATTKFGGAYFGDGQKNRDLPFLL